MDFSAQRQGEAARRPEFRGEPAHFDGAVDVKAWIRTLELIFDAKGLNVEEPFFEHPSLAGKFGIKNL